jgi:hypothetical protein
VFVVQTDIENDNGRESSADVHMYHSRLHLRHKTKLGKVKIMDTVVIECIVNLYCWHVVGEL